MPFRLTQNVIDGFGVTGVEGAYRITSEISMELLRRNKDCLRAVLDAFIHDPLTQWSQELALLVSFHVCRSSNFIYSPQDEVAKNKAAEKLAAELAAGGNRAGKSRHSESIVSGNDKQATHLPVYLRNYSCFTVEIGGSGVLEAHRPKAGRRISAMARSAI